jgi:hypothetical protein
MMYPRRTWRGHGLTAEESANLAKCAEAAQRAIDADNVRRAEQKAKDDERTAKMMSVFLSHLKALPGPTQPPTTSTFSQ